MSDLHSRRMLMAYHDTHVLFVLTNINHIDSSESPRLNLERTAGPICQPPILLWYKYSASSFDGVTVMRVGQVCNAGTIELASIPSFDVDPHTKGVISVPYHMSSSCDGPLAEILQCTNPTLGVSWQSFGECDANRGILCCLTTTRVNTGIHKSMLERESFIGKNHDISLQVPCRIKERFGT